MGKWYAKFRTGKFCPGIAFTICTNQFRLTENGREGVKLVSKMALKKRNTNFRLEYSIRKKRTTISDLPLLPEIFRWIDSIYFRTGFPGKQPLLGWQIFKNHNCNPIESCSGLSIRAFFRICWFLHVLLMFESPIHIIFTIWWPYDPTSSCSLNTYRFKIKAIYCLNFDNSNRKRLIFILKFLKKRNVERTVFVLIHSFIKSKSQQTPIEPGLPVCFFFKLSYKK